MVGKLCGLGGEHFRLAVMRRAFWRLRSSAMAAVVAAFEAKFDVLDAPPDPRASRHERRKRLRQALTLWNGGVARRRALSLWRHAEVARALRKLRAMVAAAAALRRTLGVFRQGKAVRLTVKAYSTWRAASRQHRALQCITSDYSRRSDASRVRAALGGWKAYRLAWRAFKATSGRALGACYGTAGAPRGTPSPRRARSRAARRHAQARLRAARARAAQLAAQRGARKGGRVPGGRAVARWPTCGSTRRCAPCSGTGCSWLRCSARSSSCATASSRAAGSAGPTLRARARSGSRRCGGRWCASPSTRARALATWEERTRRQRRQRRSGLRRGLRALAARTSRARERAARLRALKYLTATAEARAAHVARGGARDARGDGDARAPSRCGGRLLASFEAMRTAALQVRRARRAVALAAGGGRPRPPPVAARDAAASARAPPRRPGVRPPDSAMKRLAFQRIWLHRKGAAIASRVESAFLRTNFRRRCAEAFGKIRSANQRRAARRLLVGLARPASLHLAFVRFVTAIVRYGKRARVRKKAIMAWVAPVRRAWVLLRHYARRRG